MNQLQLFLPCAAGVEQYLAEEVHGLTGLMGQDLQTLRGGVLVRASWRDALLLNLHSRLAQRVLVQLSFTNYRSEKDLYEAASAVAWEIWFTTKQTFKIEVTAQHGHLGEAVIQHHISQRIAQPDIGMLGRVGPLAAA